MFGNSSKSIAIFALTLAAVSVSALDSVPRPRARPDRELTIYDLDLKVTSGLPVLPNKRSARQKTYRPKSGVESTVRITGSRKGMYIISIYEDGRKLSGDYLISHKWADRILDIDAVLKVAQMNKVIEEATTTTVSAECANSIPIPEPRPKTQEELDQERLVRAEALSGNQSLRDTLNSDGIKLGCLKNAAKDSPHAESLYESLTTMLTLNECGQKIKSIRSKIPSKAAFPITPISGCAVELDFLTRDAKEGDLEVELENGEKVAMKWHRPRAMIDSQYEWLYSQDMYPGFLASEEFASICPELALSVSEGREIVKKKNPGHLVLRGLKKATPEESQVAPEEGPSQESSPVTLTAEVEVEEEPVVALAPQRQEASSSSVILPESVPIPRARPENFEETVRRSTANVDSKRPLCKMSGVSAQWVKNCEALYSAGIPKDALEYALKVMQLNDDSFESDKCYKTGPSGHYSMAGVNKSSFANKMSRGLPNKCQMVINDTRDKQGTYRGRMYYIDLCSGSKPKVVKSYFNMGTGTFKNNYADSGGAHTTVKGAFFTNYKTFSFQKNNAAYKAVKSRVKSLSGSYKAPSVQLFGLSTTNNEAGPNLKYMHVSGYKSSWGCPSIAPENYWMIEKLASNGPSLVLNYGSGMEDIKRCSK